MGAILKLSSNGRLELPADIRKAAALEDGEAVSVWVEEGEVRISAVRDVMESLQARQEGYSGARARASLAS